MQLTIKTDHKWRESVYRNDVPEAILASQFDYQDSEDVCDGFFQYRGYWYHMDQFMVVTPNSPLRGWDGYHSDSYFSGIVIKFSKDGEYFKVGTYFS